VPEVGLSPAQWRQLGAAVRQLHAVPLTPQLTRMVAREAFRPTRRELLADVGALLATPARGEPVAGELAGFWRARQDVIGALVERADLLGRQLARRSFPQVLCHADLHTWNVLVDADQQLWIVDWDEAIVAPKERDLMFVVGGIGHGLVRPGDTECFYQGYGRASIDPRLLAYYRYAWAVQDIAAYAEQVLLAPITPRGSACYPTCGGPGRRAGHHCLPRPGRQRRHRLANLGAQAAAPGPWRPEGHLVVEGLAGGGADAADLNPVAALWSNLKGHELANLACDTLGEVIQATRHGIQRVRQAWWRPSSFPRRAGLLMA
jgi:hypothetical protein